MNLGFYEEHIVGNSQAYLPQHCEHLVDQATEYRKQFRVNILVGLMSC